MDFGNTFYVSNTSWTCNLSGIWLTILSERSSFPFWVRNLACTVAPSRSADFTHSYFVYTAAVIAHLDPSWLSEGSNKAWVNTLVRDFANPRSDDAQFPFSRSFDWHNGHSWAKGLFESADGKDQESTSEDSFASYAMKMWGFASGDADMEARGNLMLAIQASRLWEFTF